MSVLILILIGAIYVAYHIGGTVQNYRHAKAFGLWGPLLWWYMARGPWLRNPRKYRALGRNTDKR
jgi:hypothetical protein